MNWTEGNLAPHSWRQHRKDALLRQKQYFARARAAFLTQSSSRASIHSPDSSQGHQNNAQASHHEAQRHVSKSRSSSVATSARSGSARSRKVLRHAVDRNGTSGYFGDSRRRAEQSAGPIPASAKETFDEKRRKLLGRKDWVGITLQKPIQISRQQSRRSPGKPWSSCPRSRNASVDQQVHVTLGSHGLGKNHGLPLALSHPGNRQDRVKIRVGNHEKLLGVSSQASHSGWQIISDIIPRKQRVQQHQDDLLYTSNKLSSHYTTDTLLDSRCLPSPSDASTVFASRSDVFHQPMPVGVPVAWLQRSHTDAASTSSAVQRDSTHRDGRSEPLGNQWKVPRASGASASQRLHEPGQFVDGHEAVRRRSMTHRQVGHGHSNVARANYDRPRGAEGPNDVFTNNSGDRDDTAAADKPAKVSQMSMKVLGATVRHIGPSVSTDGDGSISSVGVVPTFKCDVGSKAHLSRVQETSSPVGSDADSVSLLRWSKSSSPKSKLEDGQSNSQSNRTNPVTDLPGTKQALNDDVWRKIIFGEDQSQPDHLLHQAIQKSGLVTLTKQSAESSKESSLIASIPSSVVSFSPTRGAHGWSSFYSSSAKATAGFCTDLSVTNTSTATENVVDELPVESRCVSAVTQASSSSGSFRTVPSTAVANDESNAVKSDSCEDILSSAQVTQIIPPSLLRESEVGQTSRFAPPKPFVGSFSDKKAGKSASAGQNAHVRQVKSVSGSCKPRGGRGRGCTRRPARDGRTDIRALPDYSSDAIEEQLAKRRGDSSKKPGSIFGELEAT